ncbi:phage holin family protein [Bacillus safensis]|uniref:phage holin family protein n=1 Tax=Bacillus safensis TaxID=561879 RepID=UPI0022373F74|nr:phage holin family protein [Bacillus safensis]MCW4643410.1 phage holin family protein [Bacillus safensis]MCY7563522.1 phage holin family protein [Bacillus safensis]MCY7626495.1 phage holin family protein [Bacillus safensis]MCY7633214.1 phage holin family protein [Bacillus safensis]MCY7648757.1 phage holin family protein [Bacillus safensis]
MSKDLGIFSLVTVSLSAMGFLFGGAGYLLMILVTLMAIELICSSLRESLTGQLTMKRFFTRLVRKVVTVSLISMAHFFDVMLKTNGTIKDLAIIFYIIYESYQIVSTARALGVPIPQLFIDVLDMLKNKLRKKP